jgi:hypothetical protein
MSAITDRIHEQLGVEVTDEQAAAVLADIAVNLETMLRTPESLASALSSGDVLAYGRGYRNAIEMVRTAVAIHREAVDS